MQILMVCTGSICRSPMGETALRDYLDREGLNEPTVTVVSTGTSGEGRGHGLDRRAAQVLREVGYPLLREHFAYRVTAAELRESRLILVMTAGRVRLLRETLEVAGEDTRKLHLWREFDGTIPFAPGGVFGEGGVLPALHKPGKNPTQRPKRKHYSDQCSPGGDYDMPDPWYGGPDRFYDTLTVVEAGATGIVKYLYRR